MIITGLARAILSQLSVVSGTRALGAVTATATSSPVSVPPNSYLVPVIAGVSPHRGLDEHQLYKTALNPATAEAHKQGGAWTVTNAGTAVNVVSAVGGRWNNLAAGTVLRWDPAIAGLQPTVTVTAGGLAGGLDPTTLGYIRQAVFYEDLGPDAAKDLHGAGITRYPAVLLSWQGFDPAEVATAGLSQGGTRLGRKRRALRTAFDLAVIATSNQSDPSRRKEGLRALEVVAAALSDVQRNVDGEVVSSIGGLEILTGRPAVADPRWYIYQLSFATTVIQKGHDTRTFRPWNRTRIVEKTTDPTPFNLVDVTEPMP